MVPEDVKTAPHGEVVVSDIVNHRVSVFNADGEFLRALGKGVNAMPGSGSPDVCTAATGCRAGANGADGAAAALEEL